MKSRKVTRYLSYLTVVLLIFSTLPATAFAGNGAGSGGSDNAQQGTDNAQQGTDNAQQGTDNAQQGTDNAQQGTDNAQQGTDNAQQGTDNAQQGSDNAKSGGSDGGNGNGATIRSGEQERAGTQEMEQLRERTQEMEQQRELMREQLQICKNDYQDAKGDFLRIRDRIRTEQFGDPERETTRLYLNASVCYMIAQLENMQYNLNNSNGPGKEARIAGIENRIIQLQAEQKNIENAEDIEDFAIAAKSVHGIWNNARKDAAFGAGQTVSERLDKSLDKSEALSNRLDDRIQQLNENGVDTTELEDKLGVYNALIGSAREKHTEANVIYQDEEATEEDLENANNLLREALDNVNEANQVLKEIFNELKQYGIGDQDQLKQQDKEQIQDRDQDQLKQQDKDQIQEQDQDQLKQQDQDKDQDQIRSQA